jgi:hypothetical protein
MVDLDLLPEIQLPTALAALATHDPSLKSLPTRDKPRFWKVGMEPDFQGGLKIVEGLGSHSSWGWEIVTSSSPSLAAGVDIHHFSLSPFSLKIEELPQHRHYMNE